MKRTHAVMLGIALLFATPGLASADVHKSPADAQKLVNAVIARGLSQRGVPFTYGGGNTDGPTTSTDTTPAAPEATTSLLGLIPAPVAAPTPRVPGFDASGLMVYSYAAAGIKLPRRSGDQYNAGRKIAPSQALPGDLIFYGPNGSQSVTMFLGNNLMLEASEPAVQVSQVRFNDMAPYLVRVIE
ncbi:cell wall-associated hydrolase, invasion-associated protein [Mycolicibacterium phlei]|uniref:NlpC/P60 family peptidoglycan-binding protein RipD n=1 Tax=Mycobacteroides chelonae TaxID=1774 RepID=UPI0007B4324C|nr:NlpC/P60 family peptidoglycan-binding protein RipD [Mycobacteroides chelonae]ANA98474.1 hydrolase [Mycobacteroides chelonae CCUG 47445]OLT72262.1 hydrolase [Mycobacteroides chelonae]ORV11581.1 hydrolase [Mycobacteroides chelonae]VEG16822.1 cell wall-associated hydrolase, invasion-associated protein [Mycolicibacterium phlei]